MNGIERLRPLLNGGSDVSERAANALLAHLAVKLEDAISSQRAKFARKRRVLSPAAVIFWSLGLLLAGWAGWSTYSSYATWRTRDAAERVIAGQSALNGFPVRIAVEGRGAEVSLLGLVPTVELHARPRPGCA